MKKLFIILVASMMVFACGSSNEGLEYIQKAKDAMEAGDEDLAEKYMQKYYKWCGTDATGEEIGETSKALSEFVMTYADEMEDFDFMGDPDAIEGMLDGAAYALEDALNEVASDFDTDDVQDALESEDVEDALEAVEKASEIAESVSDILNLF